MPMKKPDSVRLNKVIPRTETHYERGLTRAEAQERLDNGYGNIKPDSPEKTVVEILRSNIFTYFNLIFTLLALCVIAVGEYRNLTFMPVVIINSLIGIFQELRSKRALSSLNLLSAPKAAVVRDGDLLTIPASDAVLDDIAVFTAGNQIYADALVQNGECYVNEALVTGESDDIKKTAGDTLLSGSFVVSGKCCARLDKVGSDSFASRLTLEAKKSRRRQAGAMIRALRRLVQVIGILIFPLGIALFFRQYNHLDIPIEKAVVSTVAALIGMIPEGLYLLVSIALTVSVMRLAKKKTLVHEMGCIETLARVDVLCVDKTGTITMPRMQVKGTELFPDTSFTNDEAADIFNEYISAMDNDNETMSALKEFFAHGGEPSKHNAQKMLTFSSERKYSAVTFENGFSYLLGAPEKILRTRYDEYRAETEAHSSVGYRVLLLAHYGGDIEEKIDEEKVSPISLVLLQNSIRSEAPETFRFFKEQGVKIVVISGDNPITVSQVAGEAGIENADKYIDASELTTEKKLLRAVNEYIVFGRVTPEQKRKLVRALKTSGHTVAMTGDGVNDVLALRDADCSIAMASGSDVACQVSDIVLLDSDFASMPAVVMEGRRVINNIERSSALYLVKNIFSFLLAIATTALALPYPITPSQLTLYNVMLIGIPSFVFAMEPNSQIVRGNFIKNVLLSAAAAGLTNFLALCAVIMISSRYNVPGDAVMSMALIIIAFVGFIMLYKLAHPLNKLRIALIAAMAAGFTTGGILFAQFFELAPLSGSDIFITSAICALCIPVMLFLTYIIKTAQNKRR